MFKAIGKYLSNVFTKTEHEISDKADEVFTSSSAGIKAGFAETRDNLIRNINEITNALSQLKAMIAQKGQQLETLNQEEEDILQALEGIVEVLSENENDQQALEDFTRYDARKHEIDAKQAELETDIERLEGRLSDYMLDLKRLQQEKENLKKEEAETIADTELAKAEIALNQQLAGLETSIDRSPINAIRERTRNLRAKAEITAEIAGTDAQRSMEKYKQLGKSSAAKNKALELARARKAAKSAQEAGQTPGTPQQQKNQERNL